MAATPSPNQILATLRDTGAVRPGSGIDPGEHGFLSSVPFRRWLSSGVVVQQGDGKVHLDDAKARDWSRKRRNRMISGLLVVGALIVLLAGWLES